MKDVNAVKKVLQDHKLTVVEAWAVFDGVVEAYPAIAHRLYSGANHLLQNRGDEQRFLKIWAL